MKILEDIFASVSGNAKAKISDPFLGTFIVSWLLCNWNHLSILIWGDAPLTSRIDAFSKYLKDSKILEFNSLATIPLALTIFYLFLFPWLSLLFKSIQEMANERLHRQAIDIGIKKTTSEERLNIAKLKANPNKPFLEQAVQLEINRKNEILEHIKQRGTRIKLRTQEAAAAAAEAESKRNAAQIEEDRKAKQAELDRNRIQSAAAELKATQASQRFPSAYLFILELEESLRDDEVKISLPSTGNIVAAVFGYKDFDTLLNDENFNNKTIAKVKYITYTPDELTKKIEKIISDDEYENTDLTPELIFDHISGILTKLSHAFVTMEELEELCSNYFQENQYDILSRDELSGPIAESDNIFDEIEFEGIGKTSLSNSTGFSAEIEASASGHHRKDSELPGRQISLTVTIKSYIQVGKNALSEFEIDEISAHLIDLFDED
ncbi:hypothetical protein [Pseudomonas aeruginosa]|uniref:hypothetical protein n=1 Tax=Pseudomonas aeruginosa TaxID=287 RepID=UPI003978E12C